jgi:methionine biosynthesis protein MetW
MGKFYNVLRFVGLKIPGVGRAVSIYRSIWRPAPLQEFEDYDEYWIKREKDGSNWEFIPRYKIATDLVLDGESVLDIGCGTGGFLAYLKQQKPPCEVYGIDKSQRAAGIARDRGIEASVIDTQRSLRRQIGRDFDVVVLMEVLEHVVDAESLLGQALEFHPKRVIVTVPNMGYIANRLRLLFGRTPVTVVIYHMREHVRFWTVKDFREWVDIFGLRIKRIIPQDGEKNWLARRWPSLFSAQLVYELIPKS